MLYYWGFSPSPHDTMESIQLASGYSMPLVGLGTWQARSQEVQRALLDALDAGYRHFDTAFVYNNEEDIGLTVKQWIEQGKGKREDLFIVSKLPLFANNPTSVEIYLRKSLDRLQTNYLDLYLIHHPFGMLSDNCGNNLLLSPEGCPTLDLNTDHTAIWREMERMVDAGLVRSLGVSNFNAAQVKRLASTSRIPVSVNQVELHASLQQRELVEACRELKVVLTAYSPLGSPAAQSHFINKYNYSQGNFPDLLGHPVVRQLSERYHKTPGQILLRFLIQLGFTVIPKSANPTRIRENINIFDFELTNDEIEAMRLLDRGEEGRIFNFLFWKGVHKHPEYPFPVPNSTETLK